MVNNQCSWQKSRTTSGYYTKYPKKNGYAFINFRKNQDGSYNIEKRVGLDHPKFFKIIATASNKVVAQRKARAYMKKHNRC